MVFVVNKESLKICQIKTWLIKEHGAALGAGIAAGEVRRCRAGECRATEKQNVCIS